MGACQLAELFSAEMLEKLQAFLKMPFTVLSDWKFHQRHAVAQIPAIAYMQFLALKIQLSRHLLRLILTCYFRKCLNKLRLPRSEEMEMVIWESWEGVGLTRQIPKIVFLRYQTSRHLEKVSRNSCAVGCRSREFGWSSPRRAQRAQGSVHAALLYITQELLPYLFLRIRQLPMLSIIATYSSHYM